LIPTISSRAASNPMPEVAAELLEGEAGTTVELGVFSVMDGMFRDVPLRRRAVFVPSVRYAMLTEDLGYVQITTFQESTAGEVEHALKNLALAKALILDLRGNGGGLFEVAVEVARRFLSSGVIVSTQTYDPRFSTIYHAR